MNYSENHDSYKNSVSDNNRTQYTQNRKSDYNGRQANNKGGQKHNTNSNQQTNASTDFSSRLNYFSMPFVPNPHYQPPGNDPKLMRMENHETPNSSISASTSGRLSAEQDPGYYPPVSTNVNYDAYNPSLANQCLYSPLEFMPLLYQLPNAGPPSNFWSLYPNSNYYGVPNLSLSNVDPRRNMYLMDKGSDNSGINVDATPNSKMMPQNNIQQQLNQNDCKNPKQNNAVGMGMEAPAPGLPWANYDMSGLDATALAQKMKQLQLAGTGGGPVAGGSVTSTSLLMHSAALLAAQQQQQQQQHHQQQQLHNNNSSTLSHQHIHHNQQPQSMAGAANGCSMLPSSFEPQRFEEIVSCVTEPKYRSRLAETMQQINPRQFQLGGLLRARFFVIKSYSEDDLHRAIKYGVWCSTKTGNNKLDAAFLDLQRLQQQPSEPLGRLFLFFSVNGSGFFAGVAEMTSPVDFEERVGIWSQDKWVGRLNIRWHYVKDVRNSHLRHIRSKANENKPVTNSRDAIEVTPFENGMEFLKVFHNAKHETSVFDDFEHYERREADPSSTLSGNS